jgi:hypothetical protein
MLDGTMSVGDYEPILELHLQLALADVQPVFIRNGFDLADGAIGPRNREVDNE